MSGHISEPETVEAPASERSHESYRERSRKPSPAADASPRLAVDSRTIEELDAAICRLAHHLHAETYRLLVLIRDFDDRFGWAKWSFQSCAEWLAWRCQLSLSAAREKVRTAHALRELPAISAAFAAGRLSYSKARALTRVTHLAEERELLAYALEATAAQVEERCRQLRNAAPESTEGARRAWERRALSVARNASRGTLLISVELPAEDGELIVRALEAAVSAGEVALGSEYVAAYGADRAGREKGSEPFSAGTDRSEAIDGWRAQQADALVAVAKAYLSSRATGRLEERSEARAGENEDASANEDPRASDGQSASPARSLSDHHLLIVHVDEQALRGGAGRADLPIETVKRLACDGSLATLVEDGHGTPLALGRKRRVVSGALRRLLWARDRGCTFPGCHRRRYAEAHHLRHWADGGKTDAGNTTLLCSFHHRLLHEGGFRIRRRGGRLQFLRADGRVIPRSGYRWEDMVDETALEEGSEDSAAAPCLPSAEGSAGKMEPGRGEYAPAERGHSTVRESPAVYRIAKRFLNSIGQGARRPEPLATSLQ
jgi:ribosome modulation factor